VVIRTGRGLEQRIQQRLQEIRARRGGSKSE
jgi:hypothetical protein